MDAKASPLVILGFDVGDPDSIQRWAGQGHLPTIASIMKRGCWGRTAGPELVCERGIGLSLFSGVSHSEHGFYHFRQLKPGTYELETVAAQDLGVLPLWSSLLGRGKKVAIMDVPEGALVAGLPGVQLANWATHDPPSPAATEPAELLEEVRRIFGPQMIVDEELDSGFGRELEIYRLLLERVEKKGELCRNLLKRDSFDLVAIGFNDTHTAAHQFWKYRQEAHSKDVTMKENQLTHAMRDVYRAVDKQMGLLLAQLPAGANVFILSLFGMQDQYPHTGLIEAFCRNLGYQAPPSLSRPGPLTLVRRIVPKSWRVAISRHLPRTTQERLLTDQLRRGTNWQRTSVFPIPCWDIGFLRVNLRGREPEGIVEPGAGYESLLDRLETDLEQLADAETGRPVVKKVVRTTRNYGCGPPAVLPDLFVEWEPTPRFRREVLHPRAALTQQKPISCPGSEETFHGFVAAAGPSIGARGPVGDISLLDFAPTFLSLLGEPIPPKLTGKVVEGMRDPVSPYGALGS